MRARDLLPLLLTLVACGELKVAADADGGAGGQDSAPPPGVDLPDGGAPDADASVIPPADKVVKLPVATSAIFAGSLSIAADDAGEVSLAWLETPSAQRHLHVARISGGAQPPSVVVTSDTSLEATPSFVGQAVSTFTPSKGCFGVAWGQAGLLRVAAVAADGKPGASSVLATIGAGPVPRLSQVRTATDGAGHALVAWSEVARFGGDATGLFRSATLGFAGCAPGAVAIDADPLSTGPLPYQVPPAGAPELAVTYAAGGFRTALQYNMANTIFGVQHRARADAVTWAAPTSVDDGGTVTAGGSLGIAANGAKLAVAYYRRTSDTNGDLVVGTLAADGTWTGESVLEKDVLIGTAATTNLEAARLAVAGRAAGGAVIAAIFVRDAGTSELRIYRADANAPGGFRSELLDSNVFGPRGSQDNHALVDVAVDGSGHIHVAWRSGVSKGVNYARLPP